MIYITGLPKLKTFDIPLGAMLFDIIFFAIIAWFIYRGIKKGFTSLYWLAGNVIGMILFVTLFKATLAAQIDTLVSQSIDVSTLPIPTDIFTAVVDTALGIIIATVGLLLLNLILFIVYKFVKKPLLAINHALPDTDSKIIGGVAGAALGIFVAMSLTTTIYAPLWADYNTNLDNSISVRATSGLHKSIYNTERVISVDTINDLVDSINLITDPEAGNNGSLQAILDLIGKADQDPILGASIDKIMDSAMDTVEIPGMGTDVVGTIDDAYTKLTTDIFGKDSSLTTEEKVNALNVLFGFTGDALLDPTDTGSIPNFSDEIAQRLSCSLLTDDAGVKPPACPAE